MPSVLETFIIKMKLDGTGSIKVGKDLEKTLDGIDKKAEQTKNDFSDAGKAMSNAMSKARNEALALLAVFTGGRSLKAFTSEVTRANAALGYTAQRLNVNPQGLSQVQNMLRAVGGNAGEAESAVASMQAKLMDPQQAAAMSNVFNQIGIKNWQSLINRPADMLRALNRGTQGMNQMRKNDLLGRLGLGPGEISIIDQSTKSFDALANSFKNVGPTPEQIQHSQQLLKDWTQLTAQTEALGRALLDDVTPGLDAVIKDFIALEQGHPQAIEAIAGIAAAFVGLGTAIKGVMAIRGIMSLLKISGGGGGSSLVSGGLKLARGIGLRGGLKAIPFIGEAAMLLDSPATNTGESAAVDRLRQSGAFGSNPFGSGPYAQYARAVARIEGARYDQMGGFHNAYAGKYQMSRDAITDAARWLHEAVPSTEDFLRNPAMQERYFQAHTSQNAQYLMGHSAAFRSADSLRRFEILGYAHNQGAAGAAQWLATGRAGSDGFGTSGTRYSDAIHASLNAYRSGIPSQAGSVVNVGDVHIHSNAQNGADMARDFKHALKLSSTNARGLQ